MNWSQSETEIYNKALLNVEKTNKQLARVYLKVQKEISDKLKQFYISVDPSWSQQYQAQRLADIFNEINHRLSVLTTITADQISEAYLQQYKTVFESYSYNLGEYAGLLPLSIPAESLIRSTLTTQIGNYSFTKSMLSKQEMLREKLRESVAISIQKQEGTAKLAKRLQEEFQPGLMRYTTTARTEMLKAYSIAQDESVRQAQEQGIEFKFKWLGRNDGRERPEHVALNGTYAKLDKSDGKYYFYGGGCKGVGPRMFTGPEKLTARMNIQCRCRRLNIPVVD